MAKIDPVQLIAVIRMNKQAAEIQKKPKREWTASDIAFMQKRGVMLMLNQPKAKGGLSKVVRSVKALNVAATQPIKNLVKNPSLLLNPKKEFKQDFKAGKNIGKALEATVVSINPLDGTLKKFDMAGKKAGGIGRFLGNTGEQARQSPIATMAILVASYFTAGYASSFFGGGSAAAGVITTDAVTGISTLADGTVVAASSSTAGVLGESSVFSSLSSITAADVSTYAGYTGTAAKAVNKVSSTLNAPKQAAAAQAAANAQAILQQRARAQQGGFFNWLVGLFFGGAK